MNLQGPARGQNVNYLLFCSLSAKKPQFFNETDEDDCKDNSVLSSFSGYLPEQISSISHYVFLAAFLQHAEKKAHNGMGLTSCVRAEICQLWQLQLLTGQSQKLPKKIEEVVEWHLCQFVLVIE